MKINIKITSAIKFIIFMLMLINLSLTKLFPSISTLLNKASFSQLCIVLSIYLYILYKYSQRVKIRHSKYINMFLLYMVLMLIIETIYTMDKYNYSFYDCFNSMSRFYFVFLAYPIYNLLLYKKWNINKLIKIIVWLTYISYLVRICISYMASITGKVLYSSIALESAPIDWYRNGVLRINPPSFGIIFVPLCIYLIYEANKKIEKFTYLVMLATALYYSAVIHAARSALIYQCVCIIIIVIMKRRTSWKQVLVWGIICITMVALANTSIPDKIIESFSTNSEYKYSTLDRLFEINYFYDLFKHNFILGIGALNANDLTLPNNTGDIADIGLLGNIFRFGILGIMLYVILFGRYIFITIKNMITTKTEPNNFYVLLIGMVISNILFSLNIDCFYEIFTFSVPFSIAIMEYIETKRRNERIVQLD